MMDVRNVWTRLLSVQKLSFQSLSRAEANTGWNGSGEGSVRVEEVGPGIILFHERGTWTPNEGRPTTFTNVFRWSTDPEGRFLRLEHLRLGEDRPVHLFDLVAIGGGVLESAEPHVCRDDLYTGWLEADARAVRLKWTVAGPRKAESIDYMYFLG